MAARVVTESFAVSAFCELAVKDVTARYAGPETDAITDCAPANAAVRTAARMPQIARDTRFLMSILLLPGSSPLRNPWSVVLGSTGCQAAELRLAIRRTDSRSAWRRCWSMAPSQPARS